MDWPKECAVVIPCLDEAASIGLIVKEAQHYLPKVIVVDDGSRDDTAKLAAHAGAEVIRHDRTRGKGAALKSGWQRAKDLGFAWALSMDGDGQHSPTDIPALMSGAENGAALVIGNR